MSTNTNTLAPAMPTNPFTGATGQAILDVIRVGKRNPLFGAACDEVDRRVTNRLTRGVAFTAPIVECLAILDKRGIPHVGPKATEAPVLGQREKDTATKGKSSKGKVTSKARKASKAKAATATDAEKAKHVALRKQAREWQREQYLAYKAGERETAPTTDEAYAEFGTFRARPVPAA